MHELSICQAIVDAVGEIAARHRAAGVSDIHVSIGVLSGVESRLLEDAFPFAAAGTAAAHATLHLHKQSARVRCSSCGTESEVAPNRLVCLSCDDWRTELVSGDELLLERVCMNNDKKEAAKHV